MSPVPLPSGSLFILTNQDMKISLHAARRMLNTGPLFFGSGSLINSLLSLPFQNVMVEKSVHHRRLLLSALLFTCSFVCRCVSWPLPRFPSFSLPCCSCWISLSHFLVLSSSCHFPSLWIPPGLALMVYFPVCPQSPSYLSCSAPLVTFHKLGRVIDFVDFV